MTNVIVNKTETKVIKQESTTIVKVGSKQTRIITQARQGLPGNNAPTDHGLLTGLNDDDHPQYHNDARGDARYYTKEQVDSALENLPPQTHHLYIEAPLAADNFSMFYTPLAMTVERVIAQTDTGTVSFNIEARGQTSPFSAGTDINSSELTADNDGLDEDNISSPDIPANSWIRYCASAVSGSPTKVTIAIIWRYA